MTIEKSLNKTFPEIDSLGGLRQPDTGNAYRLLTLEKLTSLAGCIIDRIERSGIHTIIVCESGAVPFAKICALLAQKINVPLEWYSIKIPRNVTETFHATFHACMNFSLEQLSMTLEPAPEKQTFSFVCNKSYESLPDNFFETEGLTLKNIMSSIANEPEISEREYFLSITKNSALSNLLKKPFILFDEYIDSGKTLYQTLRFFSLFSRSLQFKVFSYLIKIERKDINSSLFDSLYSSDETGTAYAEGVYPFENRLDYLGYFYWITPNQFSRISLENLASKHLSDKRQDAEKFATLLEQPAKDTLLCKAKTLSKIPDISKWITHSQLTQYLVYWIEKTVFGKSEISDFWHQLFDMYGPMWSPFPDAWHLDYLSVFSDLEPFINDVFGCDSHLIECYKHSRKHLIHCVANRLSIQHSKHHTKVTQHIGALQ